MTIRGVNHVQITVPTGAEAEARAFYCDVLGLEEIPKPEPLHGRGGLWLQTPAGLPVHIGTEPDFDRMQTKAHVAYEVDDIAQWRERIAAAGCPIDASVPIPGYERFEFRDPFGNRVEMIQPIT